MQRFEFILYAKKSLRNVCRSDVGEEFKSLFQIRTKAVACKIRLMKIILDVASNNIELRLESFKIFVRSIPLFNNVNKLHWSDVARRVAMVVRATAA